MIMMHRLLLLTMCLVAVFGEHSLELTKDSSNVTDTLDHWVEHPTSTEVRRLYRRSKKEIYTNKIICYNCYYQPGNSVKGCLDPFDEYDIPVVSCKGVCVKSVWRGRDAGEFSRISRACWTGRCVQNTTKTLTRTCCLTDYCNGADANHGSIFFVVMVMMTIVYSVL